MWAFYLCIDVLHCSGSSYVSLFHLCACFCCRCRVGCIRRVRSHCLLDRFQQMSMNLVCLSVHSFQNAYSLINEALALPSADVGYGGRGHSHHHRPVLRAFMLLSLLSIAPSTLICVNHSLDRPSAASQDLSPDILAGALTQGDAYRSPLRSNIRTWVVSGLPGQCLLQCRSILLPILAVQVVRVVNYMSHLLLSLLLRLLKTRRNSS